MFGTFIKNILHISKNTFYSRSITQKPLQWFLDNKQLFEKHDKTSGQTKEQKEPYESGDYKNYFNLVNHHEERKIGDIFHRAMFTVFLLRCLQSQGYFPTPPSEKLSDDEVYIGTLLMHFLELLQFNAHEVAQFEMVRYLLQNPMQHLIYISYLLF